MVGLLFSTGIAAQETEPAPVRVTLNGVVFDALTGTPIPGAAVYLEEEGHGVLSDSLGLFRFDDVAAGPHLIAATQFGYEEMALVADVPEEPGAFVEVELAPQPILLEGITAVVDNISTMERRFRSRRRAAPYQTRVFGQERLLRTASSNTLEFMALETFYRPVPCPDAAGIVGTGNPAQIVDANRLSQVAGTMSTRCIIRRGRFVSPKVYIDEIPAFGGLDELEAYSTAQIYLLEIHSSGTEIRAYTYGFMQRMASRPMTLIPLNLWP